MSIDYSLALTDPDHFVTDPSTGATAPREIDIRVFAPETPGDYPVVYYSHGYQADPFGAAAANPAALADQGYIVVVPQHLDSLDGQDGVQDYPPFEASTLLHRIADIQFVVDQFSSVAEGLPQGYGAAPTAPVIAGHSLGAWTAQFLTGMTSDLEALSEVPQGNPYGLTTIVDDRFAASILLSPGSLSVGQNFGVGVDSWDSYTIPSLAITGTLDTFGTEGSFIERLAGPRLSPQDSKHTIVLDGADHFEIGGARSDVAVTSAIADAADTFLDAYLKQDQDARAELNDPAGYAQSHDLIFAAFAGSTGSQYTDLPGNRPHIDGADVGQQSPIIRRLLRAFLTQSSNDDDQSTQEQQRLLRLDRRLDRGMETWLVSFVAAMTVGEIVALAAEAGVDPRRALAVIAEAIRRDGAGGNAAVVLAEQEQEPATVEAGESGASDVEVDEDAEQVSDQGNTVIDRPINVSLDEQLDLPEGRRRNKISGTAEADSLSGTFSADRIWGGAGNDTLYGRAGNDILIGGAGDDTLYGGRGDDILIGGTGNDRLFGGEGADRLSGGEGDDLLDGGAGADEMAGGAGDDIYVVDDANDTVIELAGDGIDTIRTTLTEYELGANIENLEAVNSGAFVGNNLANLIAGATNGDILLGNGGFDDLRGLQGNDVLEGGMGRDKLYGALGDDTLMGGAGADTLNGGRGNDTLTGGQGGDIFVVADDFGNDVITDFEVGIDTLRISKDQFADWDALFGAAQQVGSDVVITSNGNTLTLKGVELSTLDPSNVEFKQFA